MDQTIESKNKALVLEAFDTLFNKRDYEAAQRYWSPNYIQHSAHIPPGRDGLFNLIKNIPPTLRYESGTVVAEGDFVILHGRFSGIGLPVNWIAADIVRMKDGILVEHWDVIQDEATRESSKSGLPMFGENLGLNVEYCAPMSQAGLMACAVDPELSANRKSVPKRLVGNSIGNVRSPSERILAIVNGGSDGTRTPRPPA